MNILILLAAGSSTRAKQDKLQAKVQGKPLWSIGFESFLRHPEIDHIVLVHPKGQAENFPCNAQKIEGGATRMQSFLNGLGAVNFGPDDIIIDHNAASPWVTQSEITELIQAAKTHGASAVSHSCVDTAITEEDGFYKKHIKRESLRLMQTPQAVRGDILKKTELSEATDLSSALLGTTKIKVIQASPLNKKITSETDLSPHLSFIGEDSHAFSSEGVLVLGGLKIPEYPKLKANSDGDVILHAIGRALAQAQNQSFSKIADQLYKKGEKSSDAYLKPLLSGIEIQMISIQIEAKKPHIDSLPLSESIAKILKISPEKIRIAAMSGEQLTSFGQGLGIRASCIITLKNIQHDRTHRPSKNKSVPSHFGKRSVGLS